ncbi:MAG TPA: hypothetical protein DEA97_14175 [Bacteroidales bacterium]|nr:MAG: hypothetical protein UR43_C0011G0002 [candidate division TM6 bacterium GW2011_GWF2_33_332]OFY78595.1 MAG: hypothetical protein A2281_16470 [Bacteroidetes bacterium RIFOXYA12_FULL_38_20]HBS87706.1 hypothetical protein [Bacteroidales bacterium]
MRRIILLIVFLQLLTSGIKSQVYLEQGFNYSLDYINTGQVQNEMDTIYADTIYTVKIVLDKSGLAGLSDVHVKIWKTQTIDAEVLIENRFENNTNSQTPEGTSYEIIGNNIFITIGNYVPNELAYEVILENSQGQLSNPGNLIIPEDN